MILIAIGNVFVTEEQLEVLMTLQLLVGVEKWHPNLCGCCVTAHTCIGSFVISRDGNYDYFYVGEVPPSQEPS